MRNNQVFKVVARNTQTTEKQVKTLFNDFCQKVRSHKDIEKLYLDNIPTKIIPKTLNKIDKIEIKKTTTLPKSEIFARLCNEIALALNTITGKKQLEIITYILEKLKNEEKFSYASIGEHFSVERTYPFDCIKHFKRNLLLIVLRIENETEKDQKLELYDQFFLKGGKNETNS